MRFAQAIVEKLVSFSPIVGILGHRQAGKTTLLQKLAKNYATLDDEETLELAKESAKKFVGQFSGSLNGIDECQLAPNLFPALKERIRKNQKPGQFILSGSVRFTSRKAIKESLTGRIVNCELLPLTVSELAHQELPTTCLKILKANNLDNVIENLEIETKSRIFLDKDIDTYLEKGGLPGICFIRDDKVRDSKIAEQLNTILDRDVRMIYPTSLSFNQLLDFLAELAKSEGQPIKHSSIARQVGISEATQKKLLYAFESVFLIRRLEIFGGRRGFVVYLEDQAECAYLQGRSRDEQLNFEGLLYRNLRAQFRYAIGLKTREFQYLSRGKARIPFAFECEFGALGIIALEGDTKDRKNKACFQVFSRV